MDKIIKKGTPKVGTGKQGGKRGGKTRKTWADAVQMKRKR